MKVAILASNNGLGHIRRCVLLANKLVKKFNVTIFCSEAKISKFKINNLVKFKNFEITAYKKNI